MMPQAPDQPQEQLDPEQVIEVLSPHLKKLIDEHIAGDVDREKVYQYAEARKNELYWRGKQYVYPVLVDQQVADWSPISGTMTNKRDDQTQTAGRYDYTLNMIRGDGRKFIAVLGQRAPNVKAVPIEMDNDQQVQVARRVDSALSKVRSNWDVERLQRRLALSLWKNGTTFFHTRYVSDARKYGIREEPQIEIVEQPDGPGANQCLTCGAQAPAETPVCPGCGAPFGPGSFVPPQMVPTPQVTDVKQYPKGAVEIRLATIFKVTTPFYGDSMEDLPWLWYEDEVHQASVLSAYNDGLHPYAVRVLRALINKSTGGDVGGSATGLSAQGRLARDVSTSPTGSYIAPRKHRWNFAQYWVSPSMYAVMTEEPAMSALLTKLYPDGAKITVVEGEIIDIEKSRKEHEWALCLPEPGESIYPDPICKDYMGVQDLLNDVHNIQVETMERAIPIILYDPQVLRKDALMSHAASPGEFLPAVPGVGKKLQDSMWTTPKPELNGQIQQWADSILGKGREIVGVMPALFGGEGPAQTAYEASRKLNQALVQLSPVWNEMRSCWQNVYRNAIRQLVMFDPDWSDLSLDGWKVEVEEAIPMSWGQLRDLFAMFLDKGPPAWEMFGLMHPSNLASVHTALGMQGWTIPNLKAREAIMKTIQQLLQSPPIPSPMGLLPSIQPNVVEFLPPLVVDVVREWTASEEGQMAKLQQPAGYANVLAWGTAYNTLMLPPPGAPGAPGGAPSAKKPDGPPKAAGTGVPGGEPAPTAGGQPGGPMPPAPPSVTRTPPPTIQ